MYHSEKASGEKERITKSKAWDSNKDIKTRVIMNHSSSIPGVHRAGGLINFPVSNTKAKRVLARGAGFGLEGGV